MTCARLQSLRRKFAIFNRNQINSSGGTLDGRPSKGASFHKDLMGMRKTDSGELLRNTLDMLILKAVEHGGLHLPRLHDRKADGKPT